MIGTGGRTAVTTTVSTLSAPRVTATFDGGRFFPPQSSTWEYYFAHLYRGLLAGRPPTDLRRKPLGPPEVGTVASHSATQAGRKPLGPPEEAITASHLATPAGRNTNPEREWYTPVEEWNDIRPASNNDEAVGGDGEWSDEVTRIEDVRVVLGRGTAPPRTKR